MEHTLIPITEETVFRFECIPGVACFNRCCRDLVQALTPYDVLRLRQGLGLPSGRFLERYTRTHIGPASGLPVVTLKPADEHTRVCPFVSPAGCRVYPHRPASCRTYPLVRSLSRVRATGAAVASFYLLREPHCGGFDTARERTVRSWIEDQALRVYNAENDRMMGLISAKNRMRPGPLPADAIAALRLALYDLDAFRARLAQGNIKEAGPLGEALAAALEGEDLQLLHAGLLWAQRLLDR
ncbi:MAG: YkgJ family cysteine cluster protein [Desulfobacterales bacterium]|nr:YkgJ family cysteine cluster protein [Desulfobacterales bacterium]